MCLFPKFIYKKGFYKQDNYRGSEGQFYELGTYSKCGACEQCIAEKANNWVVRNYYEEKAHEKKCFITLTYENNPVILVKKDVQDFLKRFRFSINKEYYKKYNNVKKFLKKEALKSWQEDHKDEYIKVRIFEAGEYGELNNRPHYHIILYGWEDENPKYLGINKKGNIIYQSSVIQKTWGLGRTSYQKFGSHEVPYIALYDTPKEVFKKAYKMNAEKLKQIERYARHGKFDKEQRNNLLKEIKFLKQLMEEEKQEYVLVKEYNTWSIALGWEQFEEQYNKAREYAFVEYIEDKEFATPSPWVKKLANLGDIPAKEEMLRREEMFERSANEEEERAKNIIRANEKRKKELKKWNEDRKNGANAEL